MTVTTLSNGSDNNELPLQSQKVPIGALETEAKSDNHEYLESITCTHDFAQAAGSMYGIAVSLQGAGHVRKGMPCEDFSSARITEQGNMILVEADGHSSANRSADGSRFAVESVLQYISDAETNGITEDDFLRFFRNRWAIQCMLDLWFLKIVQSKSLDEGVLSAPIADRLQIAAPYGTTLFLAYITKTLVICATVGDGGLYLLGNDGEAITDASDAIVSEAIGGVVDTSVCDLSADAFSVNAFPRERYHGIMLMSDGFENPWAGTDYFKSINKLRISLPGSELDPKLYKSLAEIAHPAESDDVTLVLGSF